MMNETSNSSIVRVGAAQMNPTVGDLDGNTQAIKRWISKARGQNAHIVTFPELAICGYPPKDLLLKTQFIEDQYEALQSLIPETKGIMAIVGLVVRDGDCYNAAAVIHDGELIGVSRKVCLPNYRVFDEKRYFQRSSHLSAFATNLANVGVLICEDLWHPETVSNMAASEVDLIVCLSASPFSVEKPLEREIMMRSRCQDHGIGLVFCNQVGGQDELIFDGRSLIVSPDARVLAEGKAFEEDLIFADIHFDELHRRRLAVPTQRDSVASDNLIREPMHVFYSSGEFLPLPAERSPRDEDRKLHQPQSAQITTTPVADAYNALALGVRDYARKNGFKDVVIGLSGGIDSALTAAIATDALGPEHVVGVSMPSRFSSSHSKSDAELLAKNLGITYKQFAIEEVFQSYLGLLEDEFQGCDSDITEENLQARIRGALLMALSNKFGYLVLATGNKSELSVGYATLYGDMCGGLAVIGDVPKTWVYELSRYRNERHGGEWIPENTINKPPSAELRDDQLDTDSLPPYDILDGILHSYIERDWSIQEIVDLGYDRELALKIVNLVDRAEHKRRQAAIVLRVTSKAFGSDRRLPVTNKYRS